MSSRRREAPGGAGGDGQLELGLERDAPRGARLGPADLGGAVRGALAGSLGFLWTWAPTWIPAFLLVQITVLGLGPERERGRTLAREAERMEARVEALVAERAELAQDLRRLDDPVWRERVRRSLATPGMEPLTLQRPARQR